MNYIYHINIFIFCDMLGLFSSAISIVNTSVLRYNHQASFVSKSKILNNCGESNSRIIYRVHFWQQRFGTVCLLLMTVYKGRYEFSQ